MTPMNSLMEFSHLRPMMRVSNTDDADQANFGAARRSRKTFSPTSTYSSD
jgi:hypothetical protein